MRYRRFSKQCFALLLVLVLVFVQHPATASSLGDIAASLQSKKTAANVMPSPAYLLGAEGTLVSSDLDIGMGGTLFDAYAYPLAKDPDAFMETYLLWLAASGYTFTGSNMIDGYEAHVLMDTSGLCALIIPAFSTVTLLLIPEGITVGPLVLPDPVGYCSGSVSTYDSRHFYSDDTWFFYKTSSFDFDAYVDVLTSLYGFTYLGSSSDGDYHRFHHLVLKASQSETASYNTTDKCHLILQDSIKHYGSFMFCLPQSAVGIVLSTKESAGYYTFSKGSTASTATVSEMQSSTVSSTSSTKRTCSTCHGTGKKDCRKCSGSGKVECTACNGKGGKNKTVSAPNYSGSSKTSKQQWENCYKCNGTGSQKCTTCSGMGRVSCSNCDGTGYK